MWGLQNVLNEFKMPKSISVRVVWTICHLKAANSASLSRPGMKSTEVKNAGYSQWENLNYLLIRNREHSWNPGFNFSLFAYFVRLGDQLSR